MRDICKYVLLAAAFPTLALAQTINGNSMALQSAGVQTGTTYTLGNNFTSSTGGTTALDGYVGTYITLSQATQVSFDVNATGASSGGLAPDMSLAIANNLQSFSVSNTAGDYTYTSPTLQPGTYFVRTQLDNVGATQTPKLTVNSLTVSGTGVSISNTNNNANALASAQTYADNYRHGNVNIQVLGPNGLPVASGTNVTVQLIHNNFTLSTAVYDNAEPNNFYNTHPWLSTTTTDPGAIAYRNFILNNFTGIEPENAGKWQSTEPNQNSPAASPNNSGMSFVDQETNFAEANNMGVRMHNMIWQTQQPTFVTNLFPANVNGAITAANKTTLDADIQRRIAYYISANNAQAGPADAAPRADAYTALDVYNEALHAAGNRDNYVKAYGGFGGTTGTTGMNGVASIYSAVSQAVQAAGAHTVLYTNDFNILADNPDNYANGYLQETQEMNNAGFGKVVGGSGFESYVDASTGATPAVSPQMFQQTMQNMAVAGTQQSLTEFGIHTGTPSAALPSNYDNTNPNLQGTLGTPQAADLDLTDALTMFYGNPNATTFNFFDFWSALEANDSFLQQDEAGALLDASGHFTELYYRMIQWEQDNHFLNPSDSTFGATTDANGNISFNESYGEYEITVDGQTFFVNTGPGSPNIVIPEPACAGLLIGGLAMLGLRRTKRVA